MSATATRADSYGRVARTILQLLTSGALTALVGTIADLKAGWSALILAAWGVVVVAVQNALEEAGMPAIFKPTMVSEVVDTSGSVVGGVVGMVPADVEEVSGSVVTDEGEIVGAVGPIDEPA
jgi:hypothetical protein